MLKETGEYVIKNYCPASDANMADVFINLGKQQDIIIAENKTTMVLNPGTS